MQQKMDNLAGCLIQSVKSELTSDNESRHSEIGNNGDSVSTLGLNTGNGSDNESETESKEQIVTAVSSVNCYNYNADHQRLSSMQMLNELSPSKPSRTALMNSVQTYPQTFANQSSERREDVDRRCRIIQDEDEDIEIHTDNDSEDSGDFVNVKELRRKSKSPIVMKPNTPQTLSNTLPSSIMKRSSRRKRLRVRHTVKSKRLTRSTKRRMLYRGKAASARIRISNKLNNCESRKETDDSDWESVTDTDTLENNERTSSTSDGKSRSTSTSNSEEIQKLEIPMQQQLEKTIAKGSARNKLTVSNVKSILRSLITNDLVKNMLKTTLKGSAEELPDGMVVYEPKLTRSRVKEVLQKEKDPKLWPVSPIKLGQPASVGPSILEVEFPDEEDDEYEPSRDLEDVDSDDESLTSSHVSEMGSPFPFSSPSLRIPSTPTGCRTPVTTNTPTHLSTPTLSVSAPALRSHSVSQSDVASSTMGPPPVPSHLIQKTKKRLDFTPNDETHQKDNEHGQVNSLQAEDDGIAGRTRSKLPLTTTSLNDIEEAFVAPDITPDMYDTMCDDTDWQEFLKSLLQSEGPEIQNESTEMGEEDDPEFNYIAEAEEEELEAEEDVYQAPHRVSRKEVNTLIEELEDLFDDDFSVIGQRSKLSTTQTNASKKPADTSAAEDEPANTESAAAAEKLLWGKEAARAPTPVNKSPGDRRMILDHQVQQLQQQMRQHLQLVTQMYVLAQGFEGYKPIAQNCQKLVKEIDLHQRASRIGPHSVFNACNLAGALEIVERDIDWVSQGQQTDSVQAVRAEGDGEERLVSSTSEDKAKSKKKKSKTIERARKGLLKIQKDVIWRSPVFLYPSLLPQRGLVPPEHVPTVWHFSVHEDLLLILGILQFRHLGRQACFHWIQKLLMPCKTAVQLTHYFNGTLNLKKKNSVVWNFKMKNKIPQVPRDIEEFSQDMVKAPCDQPASLLPMWAQMHRRSENYAKKLQEREEKFQRRVEESRRREREKRQKRDRKMGAVTMRERKSTVKMRKISHSAPEAAVVNEADMEVRVDSSSESPAKVPRLSQDLAPERNESSNREHSDPNQSTPASSSVEKPAAIITSTNIFVPIEMADVAKVQAAVDSHHIHASVLEQLATTINLPQHHARNIQPVVETSNIISQYPEQASSTGQVCETLQLAKRGECEEGRRKELCEESRSHQEASFYNECLNQVLFQAVPSEDSTFQHSGQTLPFSEHSSHRTEGVGFNTGDQVHPPGPSDVDSPLPRTTAEDTDVGKRVGLGTLSSQVSPLSSEASQSLMHTLVTSDLPSEPSLTIHRTVCYGQHESDSVNINQKASQLNSPGEDTLVNSIEISEDTQAFSIFQGGGFETAGGTADKPAENVLAEKPAQLTQNSAENSASVQSVAKRNELVEENSEEKRSPCVESSSTAGRSPGVESSSAEGRSPSEDRCLSAEKSGTEDGSSSVERNSTGCSTSSIEHDFAEDRTIMEQSTTEQNATEERSTFAEKNAREEERPSTMEQNVRGEDRSSSAKQNAVEEERSSAEQNASEGRLSSLEYNSTKDRSPSDEGNTPENAVNDALRSVASMEKDLREGKSPTPRQKLAATIPSPIEQNSGENLSHLEQNSPQTADTPVMPENPGAGGGLHNSPRPVYQVQLNMNKRLTVQSVTVQGTSDSLTEDRSLESSLGVKLELLQRTLKNVFGCSFSHSQDCEKETSSDIARLQGVSHSQGSSRESAVPEVNITVNVICSPSPPSVKPSSSDRLSKSLNSSTSEQEDQHREKTCQEKAAVLESIDSPAPELSDSPTPVTREKCDRMNTTAEEAFVSIEPSRQPHSADCIELFDTQQHSLSKESQMANLEGERSVTNMGSVAVSRNSKSEVSLCSHSKPESSISMAEAYQDDPDEPPSQNENEKQPGHSENEKQPDQSENKKRPNQSENEKQPNQSENEKQPGQNENKKQPNQSENKKQPNQSENKKRPNQSENKKQPNQSENEKRPGQNEQEQLDLNDSEEETSQRDEEKQANQHERENQPSKTEPKKQPSQNNQEKHQYQNGQAEQRSQNVQNEQLGFNEQDEQLHPHEQVEQSRQNEQIVKSGQDGQSKQNGHDKQNDYRKQNEQETPPSQDAQEKQPNQNEQDKLFRQNEQDEHSSQIEYEKPPSQKEQEERPSKDEQEKRINHNERKKLPKQHDKDEHTNQNSPVPVLDIKFEVMSPVSNIASLQTESTSTAGSSESEAEAQRVGHGKTHAERSSTGHSQSKEQVCLSKGNTHGILRQLMPQPLNIVDFSTMSSRKDNLHVCRSSRSTNTAEKIPQASKPSKCQVSAQRNIHVMQTKKSNFQMKEKQHMQSNEPEICVMRSSQASNTDTSEQPVEKRTVPRRARKSQGTCLNPSSAAKKRKSPDSGENISSEAKKRKPQLSSVKNPHAGRQRKSDVLIVKFPQLFKGRRSESDGQTGKLNHHVEKKQQEQSAEPENLVVNSSQPSNTSTAEHLLEKKSFPSGVCRVNVSFTSKKRKAEKSSVKNPRALEARESEVLVKFPHLSKGRQSQEAVVDSSSVSGARTLPTQSVEGPQGKNMHPLYCDSVVSSASETEVRTVNTTAPGDANPVTTSSSICQILHKLPDIPVTSCSGCIPSIGARNCAHESSVGDSSAVSKLDEQTGKQKHHVKKNGRMQSSRPESFVVNSSQVLDTIVARSQCENMGPPGSGSLKASATQTEVITVKTASPGGSIRHFLLNLPDVPVTSCSESNRRTPSFGVRNSFRISSEGSCLVVSESDQQTRKLKRRVEKKRQGQPNEPGCLVVNSSQTTYTSTSERPKEKKSSRTRKSLLSCVNILSTSQKRKLQDSSIRNPHAGKARKSEVLVKCPHLARGRQSEDIDVDTSSPTDNRTVEVHGVERSLCKNMDTPHCDSVVTSATEMEVGTVRITALGDTNPTTTARSSCAKKFRYILPKLPVVPVTSSSESSGCDSSSVVNNCSQDSSVTRSVWGNSSCMLSEAAGLFRAYVVLQPTSTVISPLSVVYSDSIANSSTTDVSCFPVMSTSFHSNASAEDVKDIQTICPDPATPIDCSPHSLSNTSSICDPANTTGTCLVVPPPSRESSDVCEVKEEPDFEPPSTQNSPSIPDQIKNEICDNSYVTVISPGESVDCKDVPAENAVVVKLENVIDSDPEIANTVQVSDNSRLAESECSKFSIQSEEESIPCVLVADSIMSVPHTEDRTPVTVDCSVPSPSTASVCSSFEKNQAEEDENPEFSVEASVTASNLSSSVPTMPENSLQLNRNKNHPLVPGKGHPTISPDILDSTEEGSGFPSVSYPEKNIQQGNFASLLQTSQSFSFECSDKVVVFESKSSSPPSSPQSALSLEEGRESTAVPVPLMIDETMDSSFVQTEEREMQSDGSVSSGFLGLSRTSHDTSEDKIVAAHPTSPGDENSSKSLEDTVDYSYDPTPSENSDGHPQKPQAETSDNGHPLKPQAEISRDGDHLFKPDRKTRMQDIKWTKEQDKTILEMVRDHGDEPETLAEIASKLKIVTFQQVSERLSFLLALLETFVDDD